MNDFYLEKKIHYHDTDAGGIVYYGSYLEHLEEARTEYCGAKGIDIAEHAANGFVFPVVHLEIDYKSPAKYGDTIRVYTRPEKIGSASVCYLQEIKKGDRVILIARVVCACVNRDLKPVRIPEAIRTKIGI